MVPNYIWRKKKKKNTHPQNQIPNSIVWEIERPEKESESLLNLPKDVLARAKYTSWNEAVEWIS